MAALRLAALDKSTLELQVVQMQQEAAVVGVRHTPALLDALLQSACLGMHRVFHQDDMTDAHGSASCQRARAAACCCRLRMGVIQAWMAGGCAGLMGWVHALLPRRCSSRWRRRPCRASSWRQSWLRQAAGVSDCMHE